MATLFDSLEAAQCLSKTFAKQKPSGYRAICGDGESDLYERSFSDLRSGKSFKDGRMPAGDARNTARDRSTPATSTEDDGLNYPYCAWLPGGTPVPSVRSSSEGPVATVCSTLRSTVITWLAAWLRYIPLSGGTSA